MQKCAEAKIAKSNTFMKCCVGNNCKMSMIHIRKDNNNNNEKKMGKLNNIKNVS
jgi:hypothetical protein